MEGHFYDKMFAIITKYSESKVDLLNSVVTMSQVHLSWKQNGASDVPLFSFKYGNILGAGPRVVA